MSKLKLSNKTKNNFWLAGYCFVPGETTTDELTLEEEINLRKMTQTNSITERVKSKKITFKFEGESKIGKSENEKDEDNSEKKE